MGSLVAQHDTTDRDSEKKTEKSACVAELKKICSLDKRKKELINVLNNEVLINDVKCIYSASFFKHPQS